MDYSGVPEEGKEGAMPVAGFGWVGYLSPKNVVTVEPIHMQADAAPAREAAIPLSPAFLPAGSAAASLTQVPEPGSSLLVGMAALVVAFRRRR